MTVKSSPRYLLMVLALAGDSTMTRLFFFRAAATGSSSASSPPRKRDRPAPDPSLYQGAEPPRPPIRWLQLCYPADSLQSLSWVAPPLTHTTRVCQVSSPAPDGAAS